MFFGIYTLDSLYCKLSEINLMNMKRGILVAFALVLTSHFAIIAQNAPCFSHEFEQLIRAQDPEQYDKNKAESEIRVQQWIKANEGKRGTQATITIPVVFHVLHSGTPVGSGYNISDAKLMQQLDALNEDFNAQNSDLSKLPGNFTSAIGNLNVNFCLANADPAGNPHSGIVRKQTTKTVFQPAVDIKDLIAPYSAATGGDDIWDASRYLNFYVVNSGKAASNGTVLGWARPPSNNSFNMSDATDGVVLNYEVVGRPSPATSYPLGRNAVHEVGHWLGLIHIWGDANCGDDKVSDTPTQQTATAGCKTSPRTSCGTSDMYMNYMDYTQDNCRYLLTKGQVTRIQGFLNTDPLRKQVAASSACSGGAPTADVGVTIISAPSGTNVDCSADVTPIVRFKNFGASKITKVDIKYQLNNDAPMTFKWTGSAISGALKLVTLPAISISKGTHDFKAWTENPNDITDTDPSNDQLTKSFTANCTNIGITELEASMIDKVKIYPNPSEGMFYLDVTESSMSNVSLTVYDVIGNVVVSKNLNLTPGKRQALDLAASGKGVYFVNIKFGETSITKRISVLQ